MTEILLLGTFHFLESDINFYTESIQMQLKAITNNLLRFKPDKIAVEASIIALNILTETIKFIFGLMPLIPTEIITVLQWLRNGTKEI